MRKCDQFTKTFINFPKVVPRDCFSKNAQRFVRWDDGG